MKIGSFGTPANQYFACVRFTPVSNGDKPALIEIMNQAIAEQRNAYTEKLTGQVAEAWCERLIQSPILLLAKEEGVTLGWGTITDYRQGRGALSSSAEITFYVHQSHRGKGVGNALISALEGRAALAGKKHLLALLLGDNHPSRSLLLKAGYEVWGNLPAIAEFNNRSCSHLYMGKHLPMVK